MDQGFAWDLGGLLRYNWALGLDFRPCSSKLQRPLGRDMQGLGVQDYKVGIFSSLVIDYSSDLLYLP